MLERPKSPKSGKPCSRVSVAYTRAEIEADSTLMMFTNSRVLAHHIC
jgi:hypothetical protein